MNATEARELSNNHTTSKYAEVFQKIKDAASNGATSVVVYPVGGIYTFCEDFSKMGYDTESYFYHWEDEEMVKLSW